MCRVWVFVNMDFIVYVCMSVFDEFFIQCVFVCLMVFEHAYYCMGLSMLLCDFVHVMCVLLCVIECMLLCVCVIVCVRD